MGTLASLNNNNPKRKREAEYQWSPTSPTKRPYATRHSILRKRRREPDHDVMQELERDTARLRLTKAPRKCVITELGSERALMRKEGASQSSAARESLQAPYPLFQQLFPLMFAPGGGTLVP